MDLKQDLDRNSYIISAIYAYQKGEKLEVFFPNAPIGKIKELIDKDLPNITAKTIEEIKNLVF